MCNSRSCGTTGGGGRQTKTATTATTTTTTMLVAVACAFCVALWATLGDCYVLTQEGRTQTFLHRRLAGRQRKEIKREILSLLGLVHRPKQSDVRLIERTSAPLYMLGLYSQDSANSAVDLQYGAADYLTRYNLAYRRAERSYGKPRAANNQHTYSHPNGRLLDVERPRVIRYVDEAGVGSRGAFDEQRSRLHQFTSSSSSSRDHPGDGGPFTNEVEKQLLDESDLVMSFINHKPPYRDKASRENILDESSHQSLKNHRSFFFDINSVSSSDRLSACKFRLYKEMSSPSLSNVTLRVSVYQIADSETGLDIPLLGSRLVGSEQEGWIVFDVTTAMRDWLRRPSQNKGLLVFAESMDGRNIKASTAGIVGRKGEPSKQAFLVAFLSQRTDINVMYHVHRRNRRNAESQTGTDAQDDVTDNETESHLRRSYNRSGREEQGANSSEIDEDAEEEEEEEEEDEEEGEERNDGSVDVSDNKVTTRVGSPQDSPASNDDITSQRAKSKRGAKKKGRRRKKQKGRKSHCHKREMYISFEDLSWNEWIIAPPGYHAHFCYGECSFPLDAHMNATNHAIVQALVQLSAPKARLPKPCCSPTALGEISVLYYDNGTLVYKKYQKMVVESCGCR